MAAINLLTFARFDGLGENEVRWRTKEPDVQVTSTIEEFMKHDLGPRLLSIHAMREDAFTTDDRFTLSGNTFIQDQGIVMLSLQEAKNTLSEEVMGDVIEGSSCISVDQLHSGIGLGIRERVIVAAAIIQKAFPIPQPLQ
jgi:hypothetical protein